MFSAKLITARKLWRTALLVCACLTTLLPAAAQTWTPTLAPSLDWLSLASSADGNRLLAAGYSALYLSTNAGVSWTTNNVPTHNWACVASSADGNELIAGAGWTTTGPIYYSTNGGGLWTASSVPFNYWASLAMSADGTKVMALPSNNTLLYVSTNSGATWTTNASPNNRLLNVVSSANGSRWIAVEGVLNGAAFFISTNFGASWASNYINATLLDSPHLAASADGTILAVAQGGNGGLIYTSTNSGLSWATNNSVRKVWSSVAASADGRRMIAVSYPAIYTSTDLGVTWVSNIAPNLSWSAVASSADGHSLAAAAFPGGIYTFHTTPSPSLNLNLSASNGGLSWIVPTTNFVLQQSTDLTSWSNVTNTPTFNPTNLQNQVTLPLFNNEGFYRLTTP